MSENLADLITGSYIQPIMIPGVPAPKPSDLILNLDDFFSSLKVDPEVMRQKSVTVTFKINKMKKAFDELEATVNKTNNYWIGEAADAHREFFNTSKPEIEEMFKRLSEHSRELAEMAATYSNVEKEVTQLSENLPSDVII